MWLLFLKLPKRKATLQGVLDRRVHFRRKKDDKISNGMKYILTIYNHNILVLFKVFVESIVLVTFKS